MTEVASSLKFAKSYVVFASLLVEKRVYINDNLTD
ncbi:hypothetical protein J2X69_000742 [Algoriphagus sp. 4150]|nr:hypothetical protein [Algoriphagus sp. 4150]